MMVAMVSLPLPLSRRAFALLLLLILVSGAGCGLLPSVTETPPGALTFTTYIELGMPEQDAFIGGDSAAPDPVSRISVPDAYVPQILSRPIFALARPARHDPLKLRRDPFGPFPRGRLLPVTVQGWLGARGRGSYSVDGATARLEAAFSSLIPNSVYSLWCARHTYASDVTVERACDATNAAASFTTDAAGAATVRLTLSPLAPSTEETGTLIELIYHSDGRARAPSESEPGVTTHIQLFADLLPSKR